MSPKKLSVRMDRATGNLWLTEEKYRQNPRKIKDITQDVYLAMCADLEMETGTKSVSREIRFGDGTAARITIEDIPNVEPDPA